MSVRESLWIALDPDLIAAIDALARGKNITRHEAARIILKLGCEVLQRQARATQLPLTLRGPR